MVMILKQLKYTTAICVMMLALPPQAQELPKGVFATVNGQALSESVLDFNIQANISRGIADSPQLRTAVKSELVGQVLLAQEARNLKLDQTPQAKAAWEQMQQNYLANLLITHQSQTNQLTEAQIKLEYEKFVKEMKDAKEYKISVITVPTQARANEIIAQLNQSKDKGLLTKLAKEESTDASKDQGGQLDWLLTQQMPTSFANVVANLTKGRLSVVPIQTPNGWNVVRLEDVRNYTLPSMKDIDAQLRQAAAREAFSNYVTKLRDKANIVQ